MVHTTKDLKTTVARLSRVCDTIDRDIQIRGGSLREEILDCLQMTLTFYQTELKNIQTLQAQSLDTTH